MFIEVTVDGKPRRFDTDPAKTLGQGGEAYVWDLGDGRVCKIFRAPDDPWYNGDKGAQEAARKRLEGHQTKLRAFPRAAPPKVVGPLGLVLSGGRVAGYTMRKVTGDALVKYSQPAFRRGISAATACAMLIDLHGTISAAHPAGFVVGDLNDQNGIVSNGEVYLIDADAGQWGQFKCGTYTAKFVDPLLCTASKTGEPILAKSHTPDSDWYAFAVMVMSTLVLVDPFGGIHEPPKSSGVKKVPVGARAMSGITVWDKYVKYPRPALPLETLPETLLAYLREIFEGGKRGPFPLDLLKITWKKCASCGLEFAGAKCPRDTCFGAIAKEEARVAAVAQTFEQSSGKVKATVMFRGGTVVHADVRGGKLMWLAKRGDQLVRENRTMVRPAPIEDWDLFMLRNGVTFYVDRGQFDSLGLVRVEPAAGLEWFASGMSVDKAEANRERIPAICTNDRTMFWCHGGALYRDDGRGRTPHVTGIGTVPATPGGQTWLWVGDQMGLGLVMGARAVGCVFKTHTKGITAAGKLTIQGTVLEAHCYISGDKAWLLSQTQEGATRKNRCHVVLANGQVEATAQCAPGDQHWLGTIRGCCAAGGMLLVPTDEGVVRVEPAGGAIGIVKEFPETKPWVDAESILFWCTDGLYVVSDDRSLITRLELT